MKFFSAKNLVEIFFCRKFGRNLFRRKFGCKPFVCIPSTDFIEIFWMGISHWGGIYIHSHHLTGYLTLLILISVPVKSGGSGGCNPPSRHLVWKKTHFGPKMVVNDHTSKRLIAADIDQWSTHKVWKCIYGTFRIQKKCFGIDLKHLDSILSNLKFGRKFDFFLEFWAKNAWKWHSAAPFKCKKRCKNTFQAQKNFIFKNYCAFRCFLHTFWLSNSKN